MTGFPTIRLETETKDFVATVEVLPFGIMPVVILWGGRVFVRAVQSPWSFRPVAEVYREVFAYSIPADATKASHRDAGLRELGAAFTLDPETRRAPDPA